jgi:hypothetical protein
MTLLCVRLELGLNNVNAKVGRNHESGTHVKSIKQYLEIRTPIEETC